MSREHDRVEGRLTVERLELIITVLHLGVAKDFQPIFEKVRSSLQIGSIGFAQVLL